MKNSVDTKKFWSVDKNQARKILSRIDIDHTYGECSSVCNLMEGMSSRNLPCDMGVINMEDLGLNKDDTFTFKDVIKSCTEKGYSFIVPSDIINYIDNEGNHNFGSQTAIMSLMDEVIDGDGIPGRIYLQPDEDGWLCALGFFQVNETKTLSKTARFLVKKSRVIINVEEEDVRRLSAQC